MQSVDTNDLVAAGYRAVATGEWLVARDAFERALAAGDRPDAMFGMAVARWWLGDLPGAVATYERTYAAYRRAEDPTFAAISALRLVVHNRGHLANRSAAAGWLARAARLIEDAQLGELRGMLLMLRAHQSDDPVRGEGWARAALAIGRESQDPDLELMAMSQVGASLVEQGRVAEGMTLLDEAMAGALGGDGRQLDTVVFTSCTTMVACSSSASFERALDWVRATERFQQQYGCPFLYVECRLVYGRVLLATGDWDGAERELVRVIELSGGVAPSYVAGATAALAELRLCQGRLEDAVRLVAGFRGQDEVAAVAARIELTQGRSDSAATMVRSVLRSRPSRRLSDAPLLELLGDAELDGGRPDAAEELGRELHALGVDLHCRVLLARGERLLGRALAAAGSPDARAHLEAALSELTRLEMPFEAARTRRLLAETVHEVDPLAAEVEARTAMFMFERLGAAGDADATAAWLRGHGVMVARAGAGLGALTRREQEVLQLLGEGLSNPAIADRMFLSRRTVEHHVSSILGKLGAENRTEAAALSRRSEQGFGSAK